MKTRVEYSWLRYRVIYLTACICCLFVTVSCVSVPGPTEQASVIATQQFDSSYHFAVASWFEPARLQYADEIREGQKTMDADYLNRLDNALIADGVQWSVFDMRYNQMQGPSNIDRQIAAALRESFDVQAIFIDRAAISKELPAAQSAMQVARRLANDRGDDAVALLYFQPTVRAEQFDSGQEPIFRLSFDYHFAVRAVPDDLLMYSKVDVATCPPRYEEMTLPSGAKIKRSLDASIPPCEREILDYIIEEFLAFARNARSVHGEAPSK